MERKFLIKRIKLIVLSGALLACTLLTACGEETVEPEVVAVSEAAEEMSYEMITASVMDVVSTERITCNFTQLMQQDVAFEVGGRTINKVYVQRGDEVKAGDLLVELEIGTLEEDIAALEYQTEVLEHRKAFLDKHEEYDLLSSYNSFAYNSAKDEDAIKEYEKRNASISEGYTYQREDFSDDIEFNKREINDKKNELSESRIYAKMSGMVSYVGTDLERNVCKKDEVIITIIDGTDGIWSVENKGGYEKYFHEGDLVDLSVTAGSSKGDYVVTPYNMSSWGETLLFTTVEGPENDGVDVGTLGYMEMVVDSAKEVVAVPSDAVYSAEDGFYVYVLDEDGMKAIKWVTVGVSGDDFTEIKSGLSAGDQIVRR